MEGTLNKKDAINMLIKHFYKDLLDSDIKVLYLLMIEYEQHPLAFEIKNEDRVLLASIVGENSSSSSVSNSLGRLVESKALKKEKRGMYFFNDDVKKWRDFPQQVKIIINGD